MTRHLPKELVSMPPQPSDPEERLAIATELLRRAERDYLGFCNWADHQLPSLVTKFLDEEFAEMGVDRRKAYGLEDS